MGKFITGVCERAGTVPVGLLCNGLAGVLMKLGETGSLSQALHQVGIGNGGTLSAVLIIAGLGGLGLANACKNRENAKKLADKIDAIDKTTDSHTVKLERIWEAVQASGVTLTAQDKLDLVAAVDAAVQKRLDRLPNPILQRLQEMGEAIQRDDAEIIEAIEAEARTLANQIAGVESRLAAILQSINAKFDQLLVTLQSQGIVLALEDRAPPLPLKYVERPVLMTALADALWGGGRASVTGRAAAQGDGGQGKSVLALAYAAEHADRYPGGCYRVVVENQSLESALARMIPALPALNQMPQADKARLARAVLSREPRCLLIIDNVDRLADWNAPSFDTLIPGGPCHVIVTSREEKLPRITPVPVGKLEPSEALAVLAAFRPSAADPRHKGAVASILRSVERLAVAVASVGALMVISEDDDWAAYAARLEAIPLDQYPEGHEAVVGHTGYSGRVFAALDDLFARLPAPAQRAMEYAALLPEDLIPAIDHLNGNPPEVKPADWLALLLAADADAAKGAARLELGTRPTGRAWEPHDFVRKLQTLGLLAPANPERTLWSLHRLHAKRIHERAAASNADRAALWAAIGACAVGREFVIVGENEPGRLEAINNPNVLTDSSIRWELTPLAEVCGALWQRGDAGAAAGIGLWLATTMLQLGRSADALNCLQPLSKHEAAVETTLGVAEFAKCYANLGTIQQGQGDLLGARASMERAIAIEQKHFSADHPTFATIYNNLAMLLRILGESDEALRYKQLSMAIERKYLGEDHPRMGASYSNLAQLQQDHGDLAGARASMERAITIQQKHFAPDHPTFGTRFSNLAMIQKDQGDLPGARASVERAIAISQKHLGPDHPNLATMRSNLAAIQKAQGDLPGARASMERAIAIEQKHYALDHPT
jgi:tetratricopeptide (TPR) repeat protein